MRELVNAMTAEDPEGRPTIDAVVERFTVVRNSLRRSKLRAAITHKKDSRLLARCIRDMLHRLRYNFHRRPSLQVP